MRFGTFWLRPPLPGDGTAWVARMHAGCLRNREHRALRRWLDASPDHARELLRAETAWRLSGALARDPQVLAELATIPSSRRPLTVSLAGIWENASLRWAAVACVTILGLAILWQSFAPRDQWYETATGEQRVITFADGTTVAINTATRIGIEYDDRERRVELERGEALFQVAPDIHRPFIVKAGTGWARAIGTRFNVELNAESVTVVVLEGVVEVAPKATERASARLVTGESAAFGISGELAAVTPERASPERITAWREGKLRFDGWSLEQAIAEHNRYSGKPIRLDGDILTNVRVSGAFRIGDTQAFLNALRELMDVQVADTGESLSLTLPALATAGSVQPASEPSDMP